MSTTGFYANGVCHATVAQARQAQCELYTATISHGGSVVNQTCMPLASDMWVRQFTPSGYLSQQGVAYPTFTSCSLEQPELFPLPSATDIGTVFAWGFSLVLVSYLTAWGLGAVLNFLKRN